MASVAASTDSDGDGQCSSSFEWTQADCVQVCRRMVQVATSSADGVGAGLTDLLYHALDTAVVDTSTASSVLRYLIVQPVFRQVREEFGGDPSCAEDPHEE